MAADKEQLALQALPRGLQVKRSAIPGAGHGIFTNLEIEKGTIFGPYRGKRVAVVESISEGTDTGCMFEVLEDKGVIYCLDKKVAKENNWMRYINCARDKSEHNLITFKLGPEMFFKVYKNISRDAELLVWYEEDCEKELSISGKEGNACKGFNCVFCNIHFSSREYLQAHVECCKKKQDCYGSQTCLSDSGNETPIKSNFVSASPTTGPCGTGPCGIMANFEAGSAMDKVLTCNGCGNLLTLTVSSTFGQRKIARARKKPLSFACGTCGNKFLLFGDLNVHKRSHTGETVAPSSSLDAPKRVRMKTRKHLCEQCGKYFAHPHQLSEHKTIHTEVRPFACDQCGKRFKQSKHLSIHKLSHSDRKVFACDQCGKRFAHPNYLKIHKSNHAGEKPFQCNQCDRSYMHANSLIMHKRTHTGERPFVCDQCGKGFFEASVLRMHIMTHTGKKPFVCDQCGKSFRRPYDITSHKRTHTGERPYVCDQCGKGFTQSTNLNKHKRSQH